MTITQEIPISKIFSPGALPMVSSISMNKALERYKELYSQQPLPENKVLQYHFIEYILPGLAYYQILLEGGTSKDEAILQVEYIFKSLSEKRRKYLQMIGHLPFFYSLLRMRLKSIMKEYPPEGWQTEWVQADGIAVRFNMRSCFYQDTLKKYGAAELTPVFCVVDDVLYENMSPHIKWKRTHIIGRGETYCDFCFERVR